MTREGRTCNAPSPRTRISRDTHQAVASNTLSRSVLIMSYARKTQSRAETEANARILRALVKQPENKLCADCKRNDARWASWNIGCFLCIRCSGFHRSMGTHISRVKSIDLDIWTPEQMASIQKWGNKRANLYWEAHLKPGHAPPDHKVESFIRSKYESRRWVMDIPIPQDPSILDQGTEVVAAPAQITAPERTNVATAAAPPTAASKPKTTALLDLLGDDDSATKVAPTRSAAPILSKTPTPATTASETRTTPASKSTTASSLFELDWDGPTSSTQLNQSIQQASTTSSMPSGMRAKNEILSLFSAPPPPKPNSTNDKLFSSLPTSQDFGLSSQLGTLSLDATPVPSTAASRAPPAPDLFNTQDIWGSKDHTKKSTSNTDDVFADIWGDFK